MLHLRLAVLAALAGVTVAALSCAQPPDDRMRRTRQAFGDLRDLTRAHEWAPEHFEAASGAVEAAERELAAQKSRFSWRRDYTKASELIQAAGADLELARGAAEAGKARAEQQARDALHAASSAIVHARSALLLLPAARDTSLRRAHPESVLDDLQDRIEEVRNKIVAEQYKDATRTAEQVIDEVTVLVRDLTRGARR